MMIRFLFGWLAMVLFLQPLAEARQSAPVPEFSGVRFSGAGDVTRVILESDREIGSEVFYEAAADGRLSVLVDLPLAVWSLDGMTRSGGMADGEGLVLRYRYGQWGPEGSRLVLDLAQPAKVFRVLSLPPSAEAPSWRLAIDLSPDTEKGFLAEARRDEKTLARRNATLAAVSVSASAEPAPEPAVIRRPEEEARPPAPASLPATLPKRRYVIVIDPGHGGKDPGAISKTKVQEKDVNLLAALALKAILEKNPRFDVKLTREDDRFIDLEDRVTIAREWGADLFISVHADSAESAEAKGVSIYTLSERGQKRSETKAEEHDWKIYEIEEEADEEVAGILKAFVTRETNSRSAIFANAVLAEMEEAGVPLLRNSHRKAGFVVLFAPDVPAVLVELGFLTNSEDVMRLVSPDGRSRTVRALAEAIDAYFREAERGPAGR